MRYVSTSGGELATLFGDHEASHNPTELRGDAVDYTRFALSVDDKEEEIGGKNRKIDLLCALSLSLWEKFLSSAKNDNS